MILAYIHNRLACEFNCIGLVTDVTELLSILQNQVLKEIK
jgi:hypothetical protein